MKIQHLITLVAMLSLFVTSNVSAQTSLYPYDSHSDSQPWVASEPLDLQRAIGGWKSCETPEEGEDRVYTYNEGGYYGTTQAASGCTNILLSAGYQGLTGSFEEYVGSSVTRSGSFTVDKDKNIAVTLKSGKKLLIITDQLMAGVLVVREL